MRTLAFLLADYYSSINAVGLAQSAGLNPSMLFTEIPIWISIPLYIAIFCTLFVAISCILRAVGWLYGRFTS